MVAVSLNEEALRHARALIRAGDFEADERDDWSEHAPSARQESAFIKAHSMDDYGRWHLGIYDGETAGTKGRYSFPFGDFTKVHRCAVLSLESRAAQHHHPTIARAAKELLNEIDAATHA